MTPEKATESEGTGVRAPAESLLGERDSGKPEPAGDRFDLHSLLGGAAEQFAGRAQARGTSLDVLVAPTVPPVAIGDAELLRTALYGVIDEAVSLTEQGEVVASITSAQAQGGRALLHVEVSDTGTGAPNGASQSQLVERLDGQFGRSSTLGLGTTTWFKVPLDVPS